MQTSWKLFLSDGKNKKMFLISFFSVCIVLFFFYHFLAFNERRSGYKLNDPLLNYISPADFSSGIFFVTYGFSLIGLFIAFRDPRMLLLIFGGYALLTLIRMLCLFILPLEPPAGIIPLKDFFLHSSFYDGRENLKDLFFSGHTATVFLFAFAFKKNSQRIIFAFAAIFIGFLLMIQHVHYAIDILAAPLAAWFSIRIQSLLISQE